MLQNTVRSWKTSVFGALLLALSGFQIYMEPAKATDVSVMGTIAMGLGLLSAKDSDKTGVATKPAEPASLPPVGPVGLGSNQ